MAYSGGQVTQLRPSGHAQAKPAGAFAGKTEETITLLVGSLRLMGHGR